MGEEVVIRMAHIRAAGMCSRGARQWFDVRGLNWSDFLSNGVPASVLVETGDALALRVVERSSYTGWCMAHNCTHGHCPLWCEHPQPVMHTSGILVCQSCFHYDGSLTEIVPCQPETCRDRL